MCGAAGSKALNSAQDLGRSQHDVKIVMSGMLKIDDSDMPMKSKISPCLAKGMLLLMSTVVTSLFVLHACCQVHIHPCIFACMLETHASLRVACIGCDVQGINVA